MRFFVLLTVLLIYISSLSIAKAAPTSSSAQLLPSQQISPLIKKQLLEKKLTSFTNRVKAERVARINALFSQINLIQTTYCTDDLNAMYTIIQKLEQLLQAQQSEKNLSNINTNIQTAKDTIVNTQRETARQQQNDYTLSISSEPHAKEDIQKTRNALYNDLHTLQASVENAKKTVMQAIESTKEVIDITDD